MISNAHSVVPFEEAVTDCTGGQHKVQRRDYLPVGDVPVIDQGQEFISGFAERGVAYIGSLPVVLFGDHTRAFKFVDFPFAIGADGIKVLVPREGFDPRFLYYYFRSVRLPNAGYSRHFKFLREIIVPKPSLATQRRIVDLLSRAEGIVRLRREAQAKAQAIIPALFLDMFGDPATNPKGWPVVPLGELLAEPPTLGTMAKPSAVVAGWLDLRVANIQGGQLTLSDKRWLNLESDQIERFALRDGDLLLARAIGSRDHLGKAVIVHPTAPWTFDSHLMRIRTNRERLLPEYLKSFLESGGGRDEFLKHTRQSAVQFNINGKEIRRVAIPVAPMNLQVGFDERCRAVQGMAIQQEQALKKAEVTFQSLLARAFSGEGQG